jgi:hypothetical protein
LCHSLPENNPFAVPPASSFVQEQYGFCVSVDETWRNIDRWVFYFKHNNFTVVSQSKQKKRQQ